MDPLRTVGIWLGVGAGHVAALVAVLGSPSGTPEVSEGGLLTLLLVSPETPVVQSASPAPVTRVEPAAAGERPRVLLVTPSAGAPVAPVARAAAVPAPGPAVVGDPPGFLDRVEPLYPRGARLAGVEGVVRLRLVVSADGALRHAEVSAGSGDGALDRAALEAARASTYRPARVGGRPVEAEAEASYRFELR